MAVDVTVQPGQQLRRDLELENFSLRMRLHYLKKEQGPQVATLKRTVERVRRENSKLDAEIHLAWEELTHLQRQDVITSQQKEDHDRLDEIKPEFISGGGTEDQNDWRRQPLQFRTHNLKETDDTLGLKESDGDEELEKLSDGSEEELGSFSVSENPIGTNLAEEKFLPQVSMEEYDLSTVQTSQECRNLFIDGDHITAAVHDLLKERESLYAELAQVSECNGNLYVRLDRAKEHCERWRQAFWRLQEEHLSIISYVESLGSSSYPSHHLSSTRCQVWVDKLDDFESCAQEPALQAQVKDVDELKARVSRHNLIGFDEPQGNLCLQASEVQGKLSNTYRKCPHADIKGICRQDVATQTASATQRPINVNTTNRKLQMSFNSDVSCSTSSLVTRSQSLENRKHTPPHRKHVVELHDEDMTSSDGEGVPRSSVRHVCQGCVYEVNITQLPAKEKMFFGRTGSSSFKPRQGKTRVIIESEETSRQDDSNMSGASEEFLKTYQDLRTARRDLYRLQKENVKMRNRLQEQKKLLEEMMLRLAENNRLKKGLLKTVSPQSSTSPQLLPDLKP